MGSDDNAIHHELRINVTGLAETQALIGDEETIILVREKFRWAAEEVIRAIRQGRALGSIETRRELLEGGGVVIHITKMPTKEPPEG